MMTRRGFLFSAATAGVLRVLPAADGGAVADGGAAADGGDIRRLWNSPEVGRPYRGWHDGEMDLHFMYFGTGEAMFYILPDGTTWVNDCGDRFRPNELKYIPRRPSDSLLGSEWAARYISRLTDAKHIDYLTVSHWHDDHTGGPAIRAKRFPSGREVCGVAALGEVFTFGRYFDHEWPDANKFGEAHIDGMEMTRDFVQRAVAETGMKVEAFRPGALDQIRLMHDPKRRYARNFSVRNLAANGVVWTGRGNATFDGTSAFMMHENQTTIMQNTLSMSLVVRYGNFGFYTGGDTHGRLCDEEGKVIDFEERVARLCGPVTVAKCNHHACRLSNGPGVVAALRAKAYVANVWCPRHLSDDVMRSISSRDIYPGARFVFPTFIPDEPRERWTTADWWKDVAPAGHVVVKVAPGGVEFKVYVLRNVDEEMTVVAVYSGLS